MTTEKGLPIPSWVTEENRQEFAVRLAALYLTMGGSLNDLSQAIGRSRTYINSALSTRQGISAATCVELERVLGRELFPREFFRPDIFIVE